LPLRVFVSPRRGHVESREEEASEMWRLNCATNFTATGMASRSQPLLQGVT
jgi:hypothetical protein